MGDIQSHLLQGPTVQAHMPQGPMLRGRPGPGPDGTGGGTMSLWATSRRDGLAARPAPGLVVETVPGALPPGIERRLPHRAEVLWNRLRGEADLPPAHAAAQLLAPPFSTQALLITRRPGGRPRIAFAGTDLGTLGQLRVGPARADQRPTAPIPERLVALALSAIAAGAPMHLDSDFDPDTAGPRPAILFRAVALPLAPDPAHALTGLAVAVLSWRRLLSHAETEALHSELRAAVGWLASTGS